MADGLFSEAGNGNTNRPCWAIFAGTEQELRSFATNLRLGRKAEPWANRRGDGERFEFLKSIGYHLAWQKEDEGSLVTIYHPELFRIDPGMTDPQGMHFVMMVPKYWIKNQKLDREPAVQHCQGHPSLSDLALHDLVPVAHLYAAYLDRRTRCPLIADSRFYLQILIASLDQGLASLPGQDVTRNSYSRGDWGRVSSHGLRAEGLDLVGIDHAISFLASHETFETFLSEQVGIYFEKVGNFVPIAQKLDLQGL